MKIQPLHDRVIVKELKRKKQPRVVS